MNSLNRLSEAIIFSLQDYINKRGFRALIHFELEGCYQKPIGKKIDYKQVNTQLLALGIDGELVAEYWSNQWEYVSIFNGQSPLKEAQNLHRAIYLLPKLFAEQGVTKTLIKPVVWAGDYGKLAAGCENIFSGEHRAVHIPNAVQINVSVQDLIGNNLLVSSSFAECLQQNFLRTSLACCLIYLPEEEAFERLALKSKYGLAEELCSPVDISGGHQGSIALYRDIGKHNQKMGVEPLIYDDKNNVIISENNWHKTSRIEHRLGASSEHYNPYLNVIFALLNVIDAIDDGEHNEHVKSEEYGQLPSSLHDQQHNAGAITLFANNDWFSRSIDKALSATNDQSENNTQTSTGQLLKDNYLKQFQRPGIIF
ncbi:hypothetical protein [Cognaticolwellia beringensis]|uniref:GS catalytic domain-containing protein n=1 Tax=Cognaticolwellia beringensis TaxID=1967665 RepID=A0A222G3F6_9GAMM|nr:hypothetical protein [Cognaticolwellia beringensis]ASP46455.1 hypothetical protein B5D82_00895 [Cognaticolwellia beringensis]